MEKVQIKIDGQDYEVKKGTSVIKACEEYAKTFIPRFCYHEKLKVAGNCRMCLVEIKPGPPKPSASCSTIVANGMEIFTNSEMVKKARDGVMEFILANHPLDCPVCDQAGECDLQDQAYVFGRGDGENIDEKRAVEDKNFGPLIKTKMNRCIHCTRCVRFSEDVAGGCEIGVLGRGGSSEIVAIDGAIKSELSGNLVDLCPVGALTSKPYKGTSRNWELEKKIGIDASNSLGASVRFDVRGGKILRILPVKNDEINEDWICDKARYSFDGLYNQRIDSAYVLNNFKLEKEKIDSAIFQVCQIVKNSKKIGIITGSHADLSDILLAKELAKVAKTDYYSCFENGVDLNIDKPGNYLFNAKISRVEDADFVLLVGVNLKKDSPVLNQRIRKLATKGVKIFAIDCEKEMTYKVDFISNSVKHLFEILEKKGKIFNELKSAKSPLLIYGEDVLSCEFGRKNHEVLIQIANQAGFIRDDWNGFCFLPKHASTTGALLSGFFKTKTSEILKLAKNGDIDCLFLIGTSEINSREFENCKIISITTHGDDNLKNSKVILPQLSFVERNSVFVSCEGRVLNSEKICDIIDQDLDHRKSLIAIINSISSSSEIRNQEDLTLMLNKLKRKINELKFEISESKNEFYDEKIESKDYNFYMTDLISKNSKNMANCTMEILKI